MNYNSRRAVFQWIALAGGVAIVIGAAVLLTREHSWCHWLPPHARPIYASIRLNIPDEDWGRFRSVLTDIGHDAHLSIADRSLSSQLGVDVLSMRLCADDGRALLVLDYPSVGSAPECRRDCGVTVFVYGRADASRQLTLEISRRLSEAWPTRVTTQVHTK